MTPRDTLLQTQVFTAGSKTPNTVGFGPRQCKSAVMPIVITASYETGGDENLSPPVRVTSRWW
jgi:hypothetical protein